MSTLHREWWLYQLSSLSKAEQEVVSFCKSHAASIGVEFVVNSNAYEPEQNPERVIEMTLTDFSSVGTGMSIRLRKGGKYLSTLRIPPSYSFVPLYKMAQGVAPDKPLSLFIDGPGGTNAMRELSLQQQRDIVRWMFAEAYATGARFHVPYPSLDYYAPVQECQRYVSFIRENREVYQGTHHLADVGVLFSYASEIWDYWVGGDMRQPNHNRQWYGLAQALTDLSIQYDALFAPDDNVIADSLSLERLLEYGTILVPWVYSLSDAHVELLREYVASGGELVLFGEVATSDEMGNPRTTDVALGFREVGATIVPTLDFEAYLSDPHGDAAVTVLDALNALLPNRLVTVTNALATAHLSRKGDTLYCHLVSKALEDSGFRTQEDLHVSFTLPPDLDLSGASAVYASPDLSDGRPAQLEISHVDGKVQITIPALEVYGVLVIPDTGYRAGDG
jgi:hypothetical protein